MNGVGKAPVLLFAYNRPEHTRQTLEALERNHLSGESLLIAMCDGPKPGATGEEQERIEQTRNVVASRKWCGKVKIIEKGSNEGLANSIRNGVSSTLEEYGRVIVLEDDIVTSPGFLSFMNEALELFDKEKKVMHIGGYVPETGGIRPGRPFFSRFMSCWGWATWKDRWNQAIWDTEELYRSITLNPAILRHYNLDGTLAHDLQLLANLEGRMRTWAIMWFTSIYLREGLCFYPHASLVRNIGLEGSGQHYTKGTNLTEAPEYVETLLQAEPLKGFDHPIREDWIGRYYLKKFYRFGKSINLFKELYLLARDLRDRTM